MPSGVGEEIQERVQGLRHSFCPAAIKLRVQASELQGPSDITWNEGLEFCATSCKHPSPLAPFSLQRGRRKYGPGRCLGRLDTMRFRSLAGMAGPKHAARTRDRGRYYVGTVLPERTGGEVGGRNSRGPRAFAPRSCHRCVAMS